MASSLFSLLCLVLALVLVSRVAGQNCSASGDARLDDIAHSIETADAAEARVAALCHVVCINYALPTGTNCTNCTNSTNPTNGTDGGGGEPMIPVSSWSYVIVSAECLYTSYISCPSFTGNASVHQVQRPKKGSYTKISVSHTRCSREQWVWSLSP